MLDDDVVTLLQTTLVRGRLGRSGGMALKHRRSSRGRDRCCAAVTVAGRGAGTVTCLAVAMTWALAHTCRSPAGRPCRPGSPPAARDRQVGGMSAEKPNISGALVAAQCEVAATLLAVTMHW